jgi:hypothetical protein
LLVVGLVFLRIGIVLIATILLLNGPAAESQSGKSMHVDLALVIALDVSASVDADEFELMRVGLANAFSSRQISQAVRAGKYGAIAISVVQWSGFQEQTVKIKWTRVESHADLLALADMVRDMPRRYDGGATHISGAINYCAQLILEYPLGATRRVIDIAGDGTNNVNLPPGEARDRAVESNITINALVIVGNQIGLVDYFSRNVIGGASAFVEPADDFPDFEGSMHRKLVREIAPPVS